MLLGVGTPSARLFLSLRDVSGPQRIDAYLDVQNMVLPLGLRCGAVVELTYTQTRLTNQQDRIYLVETYTKTAPMENSPLPPRCITALRVCSLAECPHVAFPLERRNRRTLDLLQTIPRSFIWSLFLACTRTGSESAQHIAGGRAAVQKRHQRPGLNAVLRLHVSIVSIIYLKIDARGQKVSSPSSLRSAETRPCSWVMTCIVDDGTGQATLNVNGRSLVCRALLMEHAEACAMENLARTHPDAIGGVVEYSYARRFHRAQHIFGGVMAQGQMARETPAMALSRRVDQNRLLRHVRVFSTLRQNLSTGVGRTGGRGEPGQEGKQTSNIDIGNQTTVRTLTLPKLYLDALEIEESTNRGVTLSAWNMMLSLQSQSQQRRD